MRFKTIVITRKKLTAALALALCAASACCAGIIAARDNVKEAIAFPKPDYNKILDEGLNAVNKGDISISETAMKILGFNAKAPESIIASYSSALRRTTPTGEAEPANDASKPASDTESDEPPNESGLPEHDAICASVGLKINNATDYDVHIDDMCAEELSVKGKGEDEPLVLVMHTHTTECYDGDEMNGETERTTDEAHNVIAVGNEICSVLESYGIKTIHDTTYHDYPSYQGSYSRALGTIERRLEENPSIKAVLDIHRDAFVYDDGSKLRVACEVDGTQTAQVMLVVGTDSMGLWHDNWRDNLIFAAKIQNAAEIMYPGLMRPVNLRTERFNGHTTRGSLILEVGSNGNTLDEAKEGGRDVAKAIAAAIING